MCIDKRTEYSIQILKNWTILQTYVTFKFDAINTSIFVKLILIWIIHIFKTNQ